MEEWHKAEQTLMEEWMDFILSKTFLTALCGVLMVLLSIWAIENDIELWSTILVIGTGVVLFVFVFVFYQIWFKRRSPPNWKG